MGELSVKMIWLTVDSLCLFKASPLVKAFGDEDNDGSDDSHDGNT